MIGPAKIQEERSQAGRRFIILWLGRLELLTSFTCWSQEAVLVKRRIMTSPTPTKHESASPQPISNGGFKPAVYAGIE